MEINEKSPPGFKGTVTKMKQDHPEIDNAFSLTWWMKKRGYESHFKDKDGKPEKKKNESFEEYVVRRDED